MWLNVVPCFVAINRVEFRSRELHTAKRPFIRFHLDNFLQSVGCDLVDQRQRFRRAKREVGFRRIRLR